MAGFQFQHVFAIRAEQSTAFTQQIALPAPQTSQQTNDETLTFMSLPEELRVEIYYLYFGNVCVILDTPTSITFTDRIAIPPGCPRCPGWIYYDRDKERNNPIALIFMCYEIYRESLRILYEQAVFYFRRRLDFKSVHDCSSLSIGNKISQTRSSQPIMHPLHHIRKLNINLASTAEFGDRLGKAESRRATESILDIVTYSMPRIQHLQLEINFHARVFDEKSNGLMQPWFVRQLCRMRHLQYPGIEFTGITTRTRSARILNAAACTRALQGVLNWHCCGVAESRGVKLEEPLAEETLNNRAFQARICKGVIQYLEATNNDAKDNGALLNLLRAELQKLIPW